MFKIWSAPQKSKARTGKYSLLCIWRGRKFKVKVAQAKDIHSSKRIFYEIKLFSYLTHNMSLQLRAQNGIWVKFCNFCPKNDDKKWSSILFLNFSMRTMKCHNTFSVLNFRMFAQNYKFSNRHYLFCAWRDLKKIFVVY